MKYYKRRQNKGIVNVVRGVLGTALFGLCLALTFHESQLPAYAEDKSSQSSSKEKNKHQDFDHFNDDFFSLSDDPWFKRKRGDSSGSPFERMQEMHEEMNRMFRDSFSNFPWESDPGSLFDKSTTSPSVDLQEEGENYVVRADIPGADSENINVKLEDGQLTISAKRETLIKEKSDTEDGQVFRKERFIGSYQRHITLPGPVVEHKMKTDYKNGVLTITIPKETETNQTAKPIF